MNIAIAARARLGRTLLALCLCAAGPSTALAQARAGTPEQEQRLTEFQRLRKANDMPAAKAVLEALAAEGLPAAQLQLAECAGDALEGWIARIGRVQEEQLAGARISRCGRGLDTRGARPRAADTLDGVHLSSTGARTVWARVGPEVLRYFEITP